MNEDVACLMLTNPNTLGIFEQDIQEISRIVHNQGGTDLHGRGQFQRAHGVCSARRPWGSTSST